MLILCICLKKLVQKIDFTSQSIKKTVEHKSNFEKKKNNKKNVFVIIIANSNNMLLIKA